MSPSPCRRAVGGGLGVAFVLALGELPAALVVEPPTRVRLFTPQVWGLLHTGVESHLAGVGPHHAAGGRGGRRGGGGDARSGLSLGGWGRRARSLTTDGSALPTCEETAKKRDPGTAIGLKLRSQRGVAVRADHRQPAPTTSSERGRGACGGDLAEARGGSGGGGRGGREGPRDGRGASWPMSPRRGDAAVRELSVRFDGWDRDDYRLTPCRDRGLPGPAQPARPRRHHASPRRRSATSPSHQREALRDIEVETLPGVVLGHKNIPVGSAGCYVPGGKYPLLASAHMSVVTAKVAGVPRVVTCAPPYQGKPARRDRRGAAPGRRRRDLLPRRRPGGRRDGPGDASDRPGRHAGRPRQRRSWPRPSGSCSAASASTSSPARPRPWSSPTRPSTRSSCATDLLGQAEHGPDSPADPADDVREAGPRDDRRGGAAARHPPHGRRSPGRRGTGEVPSAWRRATRRWSGSPTASPPSTCRS